jgi:hypothetical protein
MREERSFGIQFMANNEFSRDASGRLTFEMFRAPADHYREICAAIATAFDLAPEKSPITNGVDIVFQDYRRGEQVVGLEWDNWSGFMVVAKTPDTESLVREIADWLLQSGWCTGRDPA